MFSHIQCNKDNQFLRKIAAGQLIEWDANNYCTAFALEADGKAEQFRVHPFYTSVQPTYDPITQSVRELDPAPVGGQWTQQWEVIDLSTEEIAANQAQKAQRDFLAAKAKREQQVAEIKVTTQAGNTFDGDETSQGRMARAIIALQAAGGTVGWVMADNSIVQVTAVELTEALALAGAAQAAIWVAPYVPA